MLMSDWSADVCSSDLSNAYPIPKISDRIRARPRRYRRARHGRDRAEHTGARAVYGVRSKQLQPESAHRRAHAPTGQQPDPVAPERSGNADQTGQEPEPDRFHAPPGDQPDPSADRQVEVAGAREPV